MQILHKFLMDTYPHNILQYHISFDNLFCCPDLLVHLKKLNWRATGTFRKNRIEESNDINANARREVSEVKRDQNIGINFTTVVDSTPVSIFYTAAGNTPVSNVKRNEDMKEKVTISFPNASKVHNNFIGWADLHNRHCNKHASIAHD